VIGVWGKDGEEGSMEMVEGDLGVEGFASRCRLD
jgi:hypothetical protein